VNPPAIERAGPETPHLQRGALDLYPNRNDMARLLWWAATGSASRAIDAASIFAGLVIAVTATTYRQCEADEAEDGLWLAA
jgi:hypothetical protein